jgi:hypothetical protein
VLPATKQMVDWSFTSGVSLWIATCNGHPVVELKIMVVVVGNVDISYMKMHVEGTVAVLSS